MQRVTIALSVVGARDNLLAASERMMPCMHKKSLLAVLFGRDFSPHLFGKKYQNMKFATSGAQREAANAKKAVHT